MKSFNLIGLTLLARCYLSSRRDDARWRADKCAKTIANRFLVTNEGCKVFSAYLSRSCIMQDFITIFFYKGNKRILEMTWHLLFKVVIVRYPRHQWHQCTFKNVCHMTTCARLSKHVSFEKEMHCIIWNVWLWTCDKYLYLRKCLKNIIFFSRPLKFELILLQVLWRYNSYFISRLKENMEKICFYIFCCF